jgi:hypothetical protein
MDFAAAADVFNNRYSYDSVNYTVWEIFLWLGREFFVVWMFFVGVIKFW